MRQSKRAGAVLVPNIQLRRPYFLSSAQVCSPHSHLNMRTVRPFRGLSMDRTGAGLLPQWLHDLIGLGS